MTIRMILPMKLDRYDDDDEDEDDDGDDDDDIANEA